MSAPWVCGVDISEAQGVVSWDVVPASIVYVIEKVAEGVSYKDPVRVANRAGAQRTGRLWWPYIFLRPSQGNPAGHAKNLWDAVGDTMPDMVPAIDLENAPDAMTPGEILYFTLAVADAIEGYFGRPPMIYTYPWFERSRLAAALVASPDSAARLARCALWMADYSGGEVPPAGWHPFTPPPWTTWAFAQTSGNNSSLVAGIPGHVDHDIFNGTLDDLRAMRGLPTTPADEPTRIVHPPVDFPTRDPQTEE